MTQLTQSIATINSGDSTSFPKITVKNELSKEVLVYDSQQDDPNNKSLTNFFGTLTSIGSVTSNSSKDFIPINGPVSFYIIYDETNTPIKRVFTMGDAPQTFTVTENDVAIMASTEQFLKFIEDSPKDPLTTEFQSLIKDGKASIAKVNQFFKKTAKYKDCTFITYMLAVVTQARTPKTKNKPPKQQEYSLSTIGKYMGFDWPSELPDITITNFSCSEQHDILKIGGKLDITNVTFAEGVLSRIETFLPFNEVTFLIEVIYKPGLSFGTTVLTFSAGNLHIPIDNKGQTFNIDDPTILIVLSPMFGYYQFEVKADIPFKLFRDQKIDIEAAIAVNNMEMEAGGDITSHQQPLLTPADLKGFHIDSFGIGLGIFFETDGIGIGLEGKFHIGEDKKPIHIDDDQFAIICGLLDDEIPNPYYLAFYISEIDLNELITAFTDKPEKFRLDFPVSCKDLSFCFVESPMAPPILPDGTVAPAKYGFSGLLDFFDLSFYGRLNVDLKSLLHGTMTSSPIHMGKLFSVTGNGKAIDIKLDANGKPIRNNVIPTKASSFEARKNSTKKQIIKSGGPEMTVKLTSSPFFTLNGKVSLFDILEEQINAEISKSGIAFDLKYKAHIKINNGIHDSEDIEIKCVLKDYHNLSGSLSSHLNLGSVSLPTINDFYLGSINLDNIEYFIHFKIKTSTSDVKLEVGGGFTIGGMEMHGIRIEKHAVTFGPFDADVHIKSIPELLEVVAHYISKHTEEIFEFIIKDAEEWTTYVKHAFIKGVTDAAMGLHKAFRRSNEEIASIMHIAGYPVDDLAKELKPLCANAEDLAKALKHGFGASASDVAGALKPLYDTKTVAKTLKSTFGIAPKVIRSIMKKVGFKDKDIKHAFDELGGDFKSAAKKIWKKIKHWDHW